MAASRTPAPVGKVHAHEQRARHQVEGAGVDRVVLALWLGVYSLLTSPLSNVLSRKYEFEADRYALDRTGNASAFMSTMRKLAEMNLADTAPHPVVEFLFYSHPSIEKRIHAAENA